MCVMPTLIHVTLARSEQATSRLCPKTVFHLHQAWSQMRCGNASSSRNLPIFASASGARHRSARQIGLRHSFPASLSRMPGDPCVLALPGPVVVQLVLLV